jgi:hypothetical protein
MRGVPAYLLCLLLVASPGSSPGIRAATGRAASAAQLPKASSIVEPHAYVSLAPVPRGHRFEVAVVANIRPGFHINAHEVLQDYLIPTSLEAEVPPGFRALATSYPPGVLRKFKFSSVNMSVYEGSATLRMKLQAATDAPLGMLQLPFTLRYQACNEEACLPPVKLSVTADLQIAAADAPSHPTFPEIFKTKPARRTTSAR